MLETLEAVVVKNLKEKNLSLVTVESCTGGLLAGRIINVSGVSEVFEQGFITYSNKAKVKLVHVNQVTLTKYSAVSKEVAKEMALGGIFVTNADVCVSITGIAGPNTEDGKPVGLVYIGCCYKDNVIVKEYNFTGTRQQIREQAVTDALELLRERLHN